MGSSLSHTNISELGEGEELRGTPLPVDVWMKHHAKRQGFLSKCPTFPLNMQQYQKWMDRNLFLPGTDGLYERNPHEVVVHWNNCGNGVRMVFPFADVQEQHVDIREVYDRKKCPSHRPAKMDILAFDFKVAILGLQPMCTCFQCSGRNSNACLFVCSIESGNGQILGEYRLRSELCSTDLPVSCCISPDSRACLVHHYTYDTGRHIYGSNFVLFSYDKGKTAIISTMKLIAGMTGKPREMPCVAFDPRYCCGPLAFIGYTPSLTLALLDARTKTVASAYILKQYSSYRGKVHFTPNGKYILLALHERDKLIKSLHHVDVFTSDTLVHLYKLAIQVEPSPNVCHLAISFHDHMVCLASRSSASSVKSGTKEYFSDVILYQLGQNNSFSLQALCRMEILTNAKLNEFAFSMLPKTLQMYLFFAPGAAK